MGVSGALGGAEIAPARQRADNGRVNVIRARHETRIVALGGEGAAVEEVAMGLVGELHPVFGVRHELLMNPLGIRVLLKVARGKGAARCKRTARCKRGMHANRPCV